MDPPAPACVAPPATTSEGATKNTAPGRGEDRAPAFRSAWEIFDPAGETGPIKRALGALSASGPLKWGSRGPPENVIRACEVGKNAYADPELYRFPLGSAAVC